MSMPKILKKWWILLALSAPTTVYALPADGENEDCARSENTETDAGGNATWRADSVVSAVTAAARAAGGNALQRAGQGLQYGVSAQGSFSKGDTPLWLAANRYGLSSIDGSNGFLRLKLTRDARRDAGHRWRIGYGADVAVTENYTSRAVVHQLYADLEWRLARLTVGAKEQPMELKNQELSSGSQTFGINSRPVPQVRVGLPEYWNITGRGNWAAIKGYIAYGMQTDGRFQRDYVTASDARYVRKALYHAKAGYLRLGREDKFPLTFEGGLEMACQFGGTTYFMPSADGTQLPPAKMPHDLRAFLDATFGLGSDPGEGQYANAAGNTVGSWLFRFNYKGKGWSVSAYLDHFFEDHSQMFFEYGWRDGLYGVELNLPKNRFVSSVVYEYMKTTYQSGALYHDHTEAIPDQISGSDKYYQHYFYTGWEHWGMAMGNPLFVSPLYEHNGSLEFLRSRFKAHHIGLCGDPTDNLHYRVLYTHERNLGNYDLLDPVVRTTDSFLAEAEYAPRRIGRLRTDGWNVRLALAFDHGDLLGNNFGMQLTVAYRGLLTGKK